jgi:drug/metabolite transporter (DMT)-like permease
MGYRTGVLLVLCAAVLWSTMGTVIRLIEEAGTWAVLFWRSAAMIAVLVLWLAFRRGAVLEPIRRTGRAGLAAGLGLVMAFAGAIHAIQTTTIANAVLLFAASPFLAAILGRLFLGEPVRRATWAAMVLAIAGMVVMVGGGFARGALVGNMAALTSAFGFAVFVMALRWGRLEDMMPAVILGGGLSMLAAIGALAVTGGALLVPGRDIALSLGMGAGILALGMALYTLGSRVVPAAELALLTMAEVMLAPVWAFLLLGETASRATLAGGSLILLAIAVNAVSGMRRKPVVPPLP